MPKLRFPEFGGEWNELPFEAIFDFLSNNTLSRAELSTEGKIMNIHYGDVLIKYESTLDAQNTNIPFVSTTSQGHWKNDFLCDGDVIIADTAEDETVGKVTEVYNIMDSKIVSGLHTIPCRAKVRFALCYLGFYMNSEAYHRQLYSLMQGIKVFSISKANISQTRIRFPSIPNQEKIVSLLMRIDKKIQLQKELIAAIKLYKRGALSHLFLKNGASVPEYRFSGFTGDWEQRKLGEVADRLVRKNQDLESELPLTISAQYGLIDQNEFFDKRVASKDVSGYYLLKRGEFAYNKSTSNDAPWGAIKRLDKYEMGVVSTLYIIFKLREGETIDSDFFATYYDTDLWHKDIRAISAEGARNHGLLNIAPSDFFGTTLKIPQDIEEQKKIGNFFSGLDRLITLHQKKVEQYINLKQSMLEKLFI